MLSKQGINWLSIWMREHSLYMNRIFVVENCNKKPGCRLDSSSWLEAAVDVWDLAEMDTEFVSTGFNFCKNCAK